MDSDSESDSESDDSSVTLLPDVRTLLMTPTTFDTLSTPQADYVNYAIGIQLDEDGHDNLLRCGCLHPELEKTYSLSKLVKRFKESMKPLLQVEILDRRGAGYFSLFSALRLFLLFKHTAAALLKMNELTKRLLEAAETPSGYPLYGPGWSTSKWTECFEKNRAKWEPKAREYKGKVIFCHVLLSVFEYTLYSGRELEEHNQVVQVSLAEIDADQCSKGERNEGHWLPIAVLNKVKSRKSLDQAIERISLELQILERGVEVYSDHFKEPVLLIGSLYQLTGDDLGKAAILGIPKQIDSTARLALRNCKYSIQIVILLCATMLAQPIPLGQSC